MSHRNLANQGNDCLGHLLLAQFVFQATRPVPGPQGLLTALKSLFILRYIDEPVLRMSIERVLHGVEHVHRLTRAVSVGNPREFLQAEREDQEMAEACKRLVKNCIICWNGNNILSSPMEMARENRSDDSDS